METTYSKLERALTQYDMSQQGKRGYNSYALVLYLEALDRAIATHETGVPIEKALAQNFNDRVLTAVLRAVR